MIKRLFTFLVVMMVGFTVGVFALDARTSSVVSITNYSDLTVNNNFPHPFRLNSVLLRFPGCVTNTFSVILTRSGVQFKLFEYSGTYTNLTWIPEQGLNFNLNDVIRFTNSISTQGKLIYNYEI
jgi:hypothetical protein